MDEEFVQTYLNKMANRVNELQQENLLLKAQLEHANVKLQSMTENSTSDTKEEIVSNVAPKNKSLSDRIRKEQRES
jgi:hypothetical protein